jgi:ferric-dicitrate binding protein FerR (iron transport regulator)
MRAAHHRHGESSRRAETSAGGDRRVDGQRDALGACAVQLHEDGERPAQALRSFALRIRARARREAIAGAAEEGAVVGIALGDGDADTARFVAWTAGRVLIHNETLRDAAVEIERWHDVRIAIADARVARMRITVDMHLGSLQKTLEAVTVPLGLRYDVADGVARIHR